MPAGSQERNVTGSVPFRDFAAANGGQDMKIIRLRKTHSRLGTALVKNQESKRVPAGPATKMQRGKTVPAHRWGLYN